MFWMPDQVRHDVFGTFYETINLNYRKFLDRRILRCMVLLMFQEKYFHLKQRAACDAKRVAVVTILSIPSSDIGTANTKGHP